MLVYRLCEVFIVVQFGKTIGRMVAEKGRRPIPLQILFIVLWYGGGFVGTAIALILQAEPYGGVTPDDIISYQTVLLSAFASLCGAVLCYLIAKGMTDLTVVPEPVVLDEVEPSEHTGDS